MEAIELTQTLTDYTPIEYALHAFVLVASFLLQEYWLALFCLPMALYHLYRYHSKSYRVHFMTRSEYKPTQKKVVEALKLKIGYYVVLLLIVTFEFLFSAGNFVLYRTVGWTVDMPEFMK